MKKMFLIFNHTLTQRQKNDAMSQLDITEFVELPDAHQKQWQQIPAGKHQIASFLLPLQNWLKSTASSGDYCLIQGDFGACYLMVNFSLENQFIPVYSTTERMAIEIPDSDGSVQLRHTVKHCIFRKYGE